MLLHMHHASCQGNILRGMQQLLHQCGCLNKKGDLTKSKLPRITITSYVGWLHTLISGPHICLGCTVRKEVRIISGFLQDIQIKQKGEIKVVVGEQGKKTGKPFQLNFKINWELPFSVNIRQTYLSDAFVLSVPHGTVSSKLLGLKSQMMPFLFLFLFDYTDGYIQNPTDSESSVTASVVFQLVYCLIVATLSTRDKELSHGLRNVSEVTTVRCYPE